MIMFFFAGDILIFFGVLMLLIFGGSGLLLTCLIEHAALFAAVTLIMHTLFCLAVPTSLNFRSSALEIIPVLVFFLLSSLGFIMSFSDAVMEYDPTHEVMSGWSLFLNLFLFFWGPTAVWVTAFNKLNHGQIAPLIIATLLYALLLYWIIHESNTNIHDLFATFWDILRGKYKLLQ